MCEAEEGAEVCREVPTVVHCLQSSSKLKTLSHSVQEILSPNPVEAEDYPPPPEQPYSFRYTHELTSTDSKDSTGFSIQDILGISQNYQTPQDQEAGTMKLEYVGDGGEVVESKVFSQDYLSAVQRINNGDGYSMDGPPNSPYIHYGEVPLECLGSNFIYPNFGSNSFSGHLPRHPSSYPPFYEAHVSFLK